MTETDQTTATSVSTGKSFAIGAASFAAVFAVAFSASRFRPGEWYQALEKPPWTPPDWLFAPVWTLLYVGIALAGWRIFITAGMGRERMLWIVQLVLNGLWSWLFFALHLTALALADIVVLLGAIVMLAARVRHRLPLAFWLLVPYALWVAYALTLNAGVVVLNS